MRERERERERESALMAKRHGSGGMEQDRFKTENGRQNKSKIERGAGERVRDRE